MGRVTQSMNAGVRPTGDRQRHGVERLQLPDSILYTELNYRNIFPTFGI